jgi:hypothetical protein
MIDLSKAIRLAQAERDNATDEQRQILNTAVNMLQRTAKGKPLFKSQQQWLPQSEVQRMLTLDLEVAMRQASAMLTD